MRGREKWIRAIEDILGSRSFAPLRHPTDEDLSVHPIDMKTVDRDPDVGTPVAYVAQDDRG